MNKQNKNKKRTPMQVLALVLAALMVLSTATVVVSAVITAITESVEDHTGHNH